MPDSVGLGEIRCTNCGGVFSVPPDWRLAQCPKCGHTITRMEGDSSFD